MGDCTWHRATRFADAMRHSEAEEIFRTQCTGVRWEMATARSVIAWSFWHRDHTDGLRHRATAYIAEARDRGDVFTVTNLGAVALPHLSLVADDPDAAMREVDEAIGAAMHHLLGRYLPDAAGAPHRAAAAAGFERARVRRPEGMVALYAPGHAARH